LEELSTLIHHKQQDGHQHNVVDNIVAMEDVVVIKLVVMEIVAVIKLVVIRFVVVEMEQIAAQVHVVEHNVVHHHVVERNVVDHHVVVHFHLIIDKQTTL
jgi:hypothetical protein